MYLGLTVPAAASARFHLGADSEHIFYRMKRYIPLMALLGIGILTLSADEKKQKNITLAKIDGRHWLVDSEGKPFSLTALLM